MSETKQEKRKVAVIGAGLGGLASAVRLAHAGCSVTVYEKNDRTGGMLGRLEDAGYSWDTGPSLLTLPQILRDLWQLAGRRLEDDLTLLPLEPARRYRWRDGTVIDEDAQFWRRPEVARFLGHAEGIYEILEDGFLRHPPGEWWRQLAPGRLSRLKHLPGILSLKTMDSFARGCFSDPHLVQMLGHYATLIGSSPYLTPAAFNYLPFVQAKFGAWTVKGGMQAISVALEGLALAAGAEIRTRSEVTGFQIAGRHFQIAVDGRWEKFDGVICNVNALHAYEHLLPRSTGEVFRNARLGRTALSSSAFLLFLGVKRQYAGLAHNNVFLSDDPVGAARQIFDERKPSERPTLSVTVSSRSDPALAPEGCDNWLVVVNAPALRSKTSWREISGEYGDRIIAQLEEFGFPGLRNEIAARHCFTPSNFRSHFRTYAGSLYGFAAHGLFSPFRRPRIRPPGWERFFFAGGSTHQAGGIPLVLLGAGIAADQMMKDLRGLP